MGRCRCFCSELVRLAQSRGMFLVGCVVLGLPGLLAGADGGKGGGCEAKSMRGGCEAQFAGGKTQYRAFRVEFSPIRSG